MSPPVPSADVASVNGVAIPTREFALFLDQDRASVFAYFQQHFGAQDSKSFWTTSFAGQTPTEWLRSAALTDATRTTVQFALAYQYKLVTSPGYAEFLNTWKAENRRHALDVANHRPIYGPQQYTEANYLTYVIGNLGFELQDSLASDGKFDTSDAKLNAYYLTHVSDFSKGRIGPILTDFEAVKVQVRLAYLNTQYVTLVDRLVKSATVTTTSNMQRLVKSGCIGAGTCTSTG
jgi:hypothetical protein